MMGFGSYVDYGLFVSRFREELAEGYDTSAAVRWADDVGAMAFSAVIIVVRRQCRCC